MGFCPSCGTALAGDTRFCQSCGSPTTVVAGVPASASEGSGAIVALSSPANIEQKTMETNLVGALAYLAGFITGIIFLVLDPYKSNSFVRFHAFQSIFFNVAWVAFWIVWMILSAVLTPLTAGVFGLIALPVMLIFSLAGFAIWAFLMYQAYQQKLFKLPIVGRLAAQHAGVAL
jgi:uncharacterized membrane protein